MKVPTNLQESIITIAELQAATNWLQGQSNLLLAFVTANPQNRQNFANFAIALAADKTPGNEAAQTVAQRLLAEGLRQYATPNPPSPPSGSSSGNVIQFPRRP